jgi:AhpC/TSA family
MDSGLDASDPMVVRAFQNALVHQGLIALLIFLVLAGVRAGVWAWWLSAGSGGRVRGGGRGAGGAGVADRAGGRGMGRPGRVAAGEPVGRLVLVIGFGNLWLFDAILQAQPQMAIGLPAQGIEPAAASSPVWVQHLINWAGTAWSYHPVQAAAAAVWIQAGIALWLLVAPRGAMSRLAGVVSVAWGLVVWVFGESFGAILAPGLSWLTGAPGSAAIYIVAGVLIALPERAWQSPRLGRLVLGGLGVFLLGMAVLQAWPGRGFWQGLSHGQMGPLVAMTQNMAVLPQPGFLSGWVYAFTTFDEAHGFAVNLFVVVALAVIGAVFAGAPFGGRAAPDVATARIWSRLVRVAVVAFAVLCLADWVLVQDLGFLGGVGTDPNSMIPFALLAVGGYLALTRLPARVAGPARVAVPAGVAESARVAVLAGDGPTPGRWWARVAAGRRVVAAAGVRSLMAIGAAGVIVLGAVPLALAQASPNADPLLARSVAHSSAPLDHAAPGFALTGQYGRPVTLAELRGRLVLLSFCPDGCAQVAREFRDAVGLLGPGPRRADLTTVIAGPSGRTAQALRAFQQVEQEYRDAGGLTATGSAPRAGAVYVIDPAGHIRQAYGSADGPDTTAVESSFAVLFADAARQVLNGR